MTERQFTPFDVERWRAGELNAEDAAALEQALESDATLRAHREALDSARVDLERDLPYAAFRVEHERRRDEKRPRGIRARKWTWATAGALASFAVAIVVLSVDQSNQHSTHTEQLKGGPAIEAYLVEKARPTLLASDGRIEAGATIQLAYHAHDMSHVVLLGRDATGAVTRYFPERGEAMGEVPQGADGQFPFTLRLDENLGREEFVAVFAHEPLAIEPLEEELRNTRFGDEPDFPEQVSFSRIQLLKTPQGIAE